MSAKIRDFINFKVFLWNSWRTADPEKIENPQKIARKVDFLSLALYNAPSLHTVEKPSLLFLGVLIFLGLFGARKFLGVLSVFSCSCFVF